VTALALLALALAACGTTSGGGSEANSSTGSGASTIECRATQTVNVTEDFPGCVTIAVNQPVTFVNPAGSGTYARLSLGVASLCDTNPNAPKDLQDPGFEIDPGQRHVLTFTVKGSYTITWNEKDAPVGILTIVVR
jgi:hypothetical protein